MSIPEQIEIDVECFVDSVSHPTKDRVFFLATTLNGMGEEIVGGGLNSFEAIADLLSKLDFWWCRREAIRTNAWLFMTKWRKPVATERKIFKLWLWQNDPLGRKQWLRSRGELHLWTHLINPRPTQS